MVLHFGIKNAKTEIRRLNVEMQRLITFMVDDHVDYVRAIRNHLLLAPDLAHELSQQWIQRTRINDSIASQLGQTSHLAGFSGTLFPGLRVGRDVAMNEAESLPDWARTRLGLTQETVEYMEPDSEDEIPKELEGAGDLIMELMERLSTIDFQDVNM
jgi:hypothetical protein